MCTYGYGSKFLNPSTGGPGSATNPKCNMETHKSKSDRSRKNLRVCQHLMVRNPNHERITAKIPSKIKVITALPSWRDSAVWAPPVVSRCFNHLTTPESKSRQTPEEAVFGLGRIYEVQWSSWVIVIWGTFKHSKSTSQQTDWFYECISNRTGKNGWNL